jgi:hypothetical protein
MAQSYEISVNSITTKVNLPFGILLQQIEKKDVRKQLEWGTIYKVKVQLPPYSLFKNVMTSSGSCHGRRQDL